MPESVILLFPIFNYRADTIVKNRFGYHRLGKRIDIKKYNQRHNECDENSI